METGVAMRLEKNSDERRREITRDRSYSEKLRRSRDDTG